MTELSGNYITRVFEGPYRKVKDFDHDMHVAAHAAGKCAKTYDGNYIIGIAQV